MRPSWTEATRDMDNCDTAVVRSPSAACQDVVSSRASTGLEVRCQWIRRDGRKWRNGARRVVAHEPEHVVAGLVAQRKSPAMLDPLLISELTLKSERMPSLN